MRSPTHTALFKSYGSERLTDFKLIASGESLHSNGGSSPTNLRSTKRLWYTRARDGLIRWPSIEQYSVALHSVPSCPPDFIFWKRRSTCMCAGWPSIVFCRIRAGYLLPFSVKAYEPCESGQHNHYGRQEEKYFGQIFSEFDHCWGDGRVFPSPLHCFCLLSLRLLVCFSVCLTLSLSLTHTYTLSSFCYSKISFWYVYITF